MLESQTEKELDRNSENKLEIPYAKLAATLNQITLWKT